jgi:hypothetical protein
MLFGLELTPELSTQNGCDWKMAKVRILCRMRVAVRVSQSGSGFVLDKKARNLWRAKQITNIGVYRYSKEVDKFRERPGDLNFL